MLEIHDSEFKCTRTVQGSACIAPTNISLAKTSRMVEGKVKRPEDTHSTSSGRNVKSCGKGYGCKG